MFGQIDYLQDIQPIFNNHCIDCHTGSNGSGALKLNSYEDVMEGNSNNGLVSNKSYTSFILSLEWKVEKGGNSGIFWGVNETKDYSVPYLSAAEIQVLDDDIYGQEDTANFNHMNGALYDMVAPTKLFAKPTGEWNHYLIEINFYKLLF